MTLLFIPGVGCALINRLIDGLGSPGAVLAAGKDLAGVQGVGPAVIDLFSTPETINAARHRADEELERISAASWSLLSRHCAAYPRLLRTIGDPPVLLYARGDLDCLEADCVAVVGSRAATSYGKQVALQFGKGLAGAGCAVVSGLAYGIDAQAHRGALAVNGKTVAVLGCGIDVVYPKTNRALMDEVAASGLVLSEYPLGTRPEGFRFPARNRIISGVSLAVVVAEAALRSGSLITARLALDQGREVFAVPGRIDSLRSAGCHRLIQQGAFLAHAVDDVLQELSVAGAPGGGSPVKEERPADSDLPAGAREVLQVLEVYPLNIEYLLARSGLQPPELFDLLLELELRGLVRQLPGQQYQLNLPA